MTDEEPLEVPKWLKELEEKREKRLKVRLGHEAGAGSPCLTCENKCPGLDLHFWRKICKNCKCGKESHDVNDEDVYGWAQFQLLGSKPSKSNRFVIPGRKDAVELDWMPKGVADAVESYLKTLPFNLLPIKGSPAALERKQLLQKQIPLHDIDPSLCDSLTDNEIKQMNDYIKHVKENSVGIGRVVKVNFPHSNLIGKTLNNNVNRRNLSNLLVPNEISNSIDCQYASSPGYVRDLLYSTETNDNNRVKTQFDDSNDNKPDDCFASGIYLIKPDFVSVSNSEDVPKIDSQMCDTLANLALANHQLDQLKNLDNAKSFPNVPMQKGSVNNAHASLKDLAFSTYDPRLPNHPLETQVTPVSVKIGGIKDIEYETLTTSQQTEDIPHSISPVCHKCNRPFDSASSLAIGVDRTSALWHSACFKCAGCSQSLADLMYFYDKTSDDVYCGRDYAKIRGIPRCRACDELIFVKEYCLAESCTFHVKHFCCFECDVPLAGRNYVMEESQPLCLNCYEVLKAEKCNVCKKVIKPDEQGANLNGVHFHADDGCFVCKTCKKPLLGAKLLFKNDRLYCSAPCFGADK